MIKYKYFLLISLFITHLAVRTTPLQAQDDSVIPEPDSSSSSGSFVPPPNMAPMPPTLIDDSDSSGVSDPDDND